MEIKYGKGKTQYGMGVEINISSTELFHAINAYLSAHDIHINGASTITIMGEVLCDIGDTKIYVDPSGFVISKGEKFDGSLLEQDKSHKY